MKNKQKLIDNLIYTTQKHFADLICTKENTQFTDAYKSGLITPAELITNSKLKEIYKNCNPIN